MNAPFRPREILGALERHGVDYVAIGGIAMIAHGAIRATIDVDLIPDPDPANLSRLVEALAELEAVPHGEAETPIDLALLSRDANMRFQSRAGQIDVLLAAQYRERFAGLRERAIRGSVGGVSGIVVSREDLVVLKAGSGRVRDLLDIGNLTELAERDDA